ncbi:beta-lactamase hydrolase domain-containing protein [Lyngbya sp. PCC 8106]|uniref:beta-lactamase hydrolase domain-containing protein n=1 Tax=Lyngbya sp. (strain PCC 8106) TaxID=313612 RepID=UPI0000EABCB5|nr:protein tyrosine phosphatase family protein [Lyngbya sp. PCC 8106]EAW35540.1 hypothetical protein L8106_13055 [Lyngbya sp. PCC 8106]
MENLKTINGQLSIATNQVTPTQLQEAAQAGFKSVLNFRSPQEEGFLSDEEKQAEAAGLEYVNIPVKANGITDELAEKIIEQIDQLPKPILLHCKSGLRSGAMALMYIAIKEKISADIILEQGKEMGFDCNKFPEMKEFLITYISKHSNNH